MNSIKINTAASDHQFVGILCQNNQMTITFPIGYNIENQTIKSTETSTIKELYKDVTTLLNLLETLPSSSFQEDNTKFSYSAAVYLINDYFANGLYKENQLTSNNLNNGKINWNQTFHNITPIYSTGNLIYTTTINENISPQNNSITTIHKFCLNKALSILGIFYNNYQLPITTEINIQESLSLLNQKLNQTNIDKDRKLISMMIKFLLGTSTSKLNDQEIKIGTNYFHTIWEKFLRNKITSLLPEKDIIPKTHYVHNNTKTYTSTLRPDIIVESNKYIYLIDAKYYKLDSLPQSSDIEKQLFYEAYITTKTSKPIINIFLLPALITNQPKYSYYGYATFNENDEPLINNKVHTYHLDTKTLLTNPNSILTKIITDNH